MTVSGLSMSGQNVQYKNRKVCRCDAIFYVLCASYVTCYRGEGGAQKSDTMRGFRSPPPLF